jgi:hypothetical protein
MVFVVVTVVGILGLVALGLVIVILLLSPTLIEVRLRPVTIPETLSVMPLVPAVALLVGPALGGFPVGTPGFVPGPKPTAGVT